MQRNFSFAGKSPFIIALMIQSEARVFRQNRQPVQIISACQWNIQAETALNRFNFEFWLGFGGTNPISLFVEESLPACRTPLK
jgi:hypothetical protein